MSTQSMSMSPVERRAGVSLATLYSLRMLGLFMILPVFALYAQDLTGNTPFLIGLAIGIYGLTQALFQIPFGLLSDRIGRKPVIIAGLLIFAIGSVVAALSDSIYGVIVGRAMQGSGAIAAALMALAADLTREEQRMKVMAMIGMSIGLAFSIAMVLGSILERWIGVDGIFAVIALLACAGIAIVIFWVPNAVTHNVHRDAETVPKQLSGVLKDRQLLRIDLGIFCLHFLLTATFLVIPVMLQNDAQFPQQQHWQLYLPVMLFSMALALPFIILAEKKRQIKTVYTAGITLLLLVQAGFYWLHDSLIALFFCLLLFFIAFNVLEALLPSLVAKISAAQNKGTAMGVYSSSQFFGAFCGGSLGGYFSGRFGASSTFILAAILLTCWLLAALSMQEPAYLSSYLLPLPPLEKQQAGQLAKELAEIAGVRDVVIIPEDQEAWLKVDMASLDKEALLQYSVRAA